MFYIYQDDWNKMLSYAKSANVQLASEIGGMAILKQDEEGDWQILDPSIIKQEVSGGNCDLDSDALSKYCGLMFKKHGKDVRFMWWHSHGTMAAFMSGTDDKCMKEFMEGSDWGAFLVINVEGEYVMELRIADFKGVVANPKLNIITDEFDVDAEVKKLCTKKTYSYGKYYGKNYYKNYNTGRSNKTTDPQTNATLLPGKSDLTAIKQIEAWTEVDEAALKYLNGKLTYSEIRKLLQDVNKAYVGYVKFTVPLLKEMPEMLYLEKGKPSTYNLVAEYTK